VAIATHMFEREQHLSADAILERVNEDSTTTNVSKATVYNTLKLFVKEGILKMVALDPQRILFDTNINQHHHVLNLDNGQIRDIQPSLLFFFKLVEHFLKPDSMRLLGLHQYLEPVRNIVMPLFTSLFRHSGVHLLGVLLLPGNS